MLSSGISDVALASVHSEQTRLKKLKKHLLVDEKGDVGMAKRFSRKYGNKG